MAILVLQLIFAKCNKKQLRLSC